MDKEKKKLSCPPAGDVVDTIERAKETTPLHIKKNRLKTEWKYQANQSTKHTHSR